MKNIILFLILSTIYFNGYSQSAGEKDSISIIPQPVSVSLQEGYFSFKPGGVVISSDNSSSDIASFLSELLYHLSELLYHSYGFHVKQNGAKTPSARAAIELKINKKADASIGDEGYTLKVNPQQLVLSANKPQGLFYGIQTLMQLLPPKDNKEAQTKNIEFKIPCVNITDYPRFGYRGMMLDVSRHFFTKDFIKKYIDEMAKYKFNVFHWHLADDQGWRIEIKGLPELTKVGA